MHGVALFLPNWIGDVVMATPAIRAVRQQFPHAKLVAVGKPYVMETLAGAPWIDECIAFDKHGPRESRLPAVAAKLRTLRMEAAVLFPNTLRSAVAARMGGCSTVVGFARYGRDALLSHRLYPRRGRTGEPSPTPMVDDYNRLAMRLGTPNPGHDLQLFTTRADEQSADESWRKLGLSRFTRVVGLNPGGAFGASKHWPAEHFAATARAIADKSGTGVVVLCGPAERAESQRIAELAAHPAVISAAELPLSIGLTKAIVKRLALLLTTDSGPRHFAHAFNVPVVTLFGPTHIGWTETYFDRAVHVQLPLDCGPCQRRVCPLGHHRCMTELTPTLALSATDRLDWGSRHAG